MNRVNKYLLSNFASTFASLFSTLFIIMSIVFFIQIARITSYIEITFFELGKLYLFMLPRVLLFVVPIAFFVALGMTLFRLSKENESIVLFTLGHSPKDMAKFFTKCAALLSATLLVVALVLIPTAAELNANFIDYKKTIAKLNLKGGQFGQKFSDWMVYIASENSDNNGTIYKDVVMYNPSEKTRRLLVANSARISNQNGIIELALNNGKSYEMSDKSYHVSKFDTLKIRTQQDQKVSGVGGIVEYWQEAKVSKKRLKDLTTYVLVALFPLASVLFAIAFGVVTYRYDKGVIYFGIFGVLFGYFALIMLLAARPMFGIPLVFLGTFALSLFYYKRKIELKY